MIRRRTLALATLALLVCPWNSAEAGVRFGVRIGLPIFIGPCPCRPRVAPVYVAPQPVYVVPAQAPVYVQPAPVAYQVPVAPACQAPAIQAVPAPAPASAGQIR